MDNKNASPKNTILIVDDIPANLSTLFNLLADSGFKVLVATDGESAIEKVKYASPDMILLDVVMPGLDGFETCTILKSNEDTKDIPVIFMTALHETVDKVKGLNLGAVDYITKPLQHEEVLARVNIHLKLRNLTKTLQEQNVRLEHEIQERAIAEKALRHSEEKFRQIVDTAQEGIWLLDTDANTTYVNQRMSDMLGYSVEEMLNRSWFDFIDDAAKVEAELKLERRQEMNEQYDLQFLRKDGSQLWTIVSTSPMRGKNTEFIGTLNMLTDITDRQCSEQKIREQAALLDITTDAILVQDLENKISFWNKGAEALYGWKAEEAIDKNNLPIWYKEQSKFKSILRILLQKGEWEGDLNQVTKNGKEIIVFSRWTLVNDRADRPKSILIVNTDISEKKQLEKHLRRSQRMDSLGTLASGIAHDLNNVLSPILMAIQLLEIKIHDRSSQQLLSIVEANAKRGADLVKQVLLFAQGGESDRQLLDIKNLILETEKIIKEIFPKSIQIDTNISPNLWFISADPTQIHQLFLNLCVNARDAMPNGGVLTISAENDVIDENYVQMNLDAKIGSHVMLSFSDTGSGISPENLERIFEPFYTTKELGKGTGLGLSTVAGIVKGHGGFIEVSSLVGKGTEFKVYLPATDKNTEITQEQERTQILLGHGEVILVVDDEDSIREVTKKSLETYGYKVINASEGVEAIALYAQYKEEIDVVLVDMMMPFMDGATTIRTLHKMNPNVKVIAVSGLVPNNKIAETLGNQVKIFLPKPYTTEELLQNLHRVIALN